jgi:hypothetical protein
VNRIRMALTVGAIPVLGWLMLRITRNLVVVKPADHAHFAVTGYGPIQLLRVGDYATVRVEISGEWVEVIRELVDNNFDHTVYPSGIVEELERQKCAP